MSVLKPSIFSKDYEKRMKKIRIRRTIIAILVIILGILFFTRDNYLKNIKKINITKIFKSTVAKKDNTNKVDSTKKSGGQIVKDNTEEKLYPVQLKDSVVKAVFTKNSKTSEFKDLQSNDQNACLFNISASGKKMVILDKKTQQLFILDESGDVKDLTMKSYVSTSGSTFNREDVLSNNTSYIWTDTPTFIDEDNVAFISSLPWFDGRTTKYVWICNISSNSYRTIFGIEGNDVKFSNIKNGALTVISDGKTVYLKSDGTVSDSI